jgi:hypothetical protein
VGDLTERGLEFFSEIRGAERGGGGFDSAMTALAVDFVFGSVWTRPALDGKQRSLVTLGLVDFWSSCREEDKIFRRWYGRLPLTLSDDSSAGYLVRSQPIGRHWKFGNCK